MSNITNLISALKVSANSSIDFINNTSFPENPLFGQVAFINQILYIYSNINDIKTWYPLTTIRENYTHIQAGSSSIWIIEHNLDSSHPFYMVYDNDNNYLIVKASNITNNSFQLNFSESVSGKCFVFVAKESELAWTLGDSFEKQTIGSSDIIVKGNLIPLTNVTFNLGSNLNSWKDVYLSGSTINVGDNLSLSGNSIQINPPDSPLLESEQPVFSTSLLDLKKITYDSTTLLSSIIANEDLTIGGNNKQIVINGGVNGRFIVNASNFSLDSFGNFEYSGILTINQSFDGGIW